MRLIRKLGGQLREYTQYRWSLLSKVFPRPSVASTISLTYPSLVAWPYTHRRHHNHPRRRHRSCDDRYLAIIGNDTCRLPLVATFNHPQRKREREREKR